MIRPCQVQSTTRAALTEVVRPGSLPCEVGEVGVEAESRRDLEEDRALYSLPCEAEEGWGGGGRSP
jgi:hypothetical protein